MASGRHELFPFCSNTHALTGFTHTSKRLALLRLSPLFAWPHAPHTRAPLNPAALAFVPFGIVLVRVRVRKLAQSHI